MSEEINDTLDDVTGVESNGDVVDPIAAKDREIYEKRYARDTAEEEMVAILEDASNESRDVHRILSVSSNILGNVGTLGRMADSDRVPALTMLHDFAVDTGFSPQSLDVSMERNNDFVFSEGIISSIINWTGQAISASFKVMGYALKRGALFVSRTRKDADQLDKRLTRLDGMMRSRKNEDNSLFFDKSKLMMFVEEYDVNTAPAGSIGTYTGAIYGIIDVKMDMLRKLISKAESDLMSESDIEIDDYKKIVTDMVEELESKYKDKQEFIGNRYIKVHPSAKMDKLITFEVGRPDPKSVIGKYRPMKALTNSQVDSQRSTLRTGALKRMYQMIDSTSEDLKGISEFNKANKAKKKDDDLEFDKKDVADLGKFLNDHIEPTITSIMELARYAYDLVDANVTLLEDSVTVTTIVDEKKLTEPERKLGKNLGDPSHVLDR